MGKIMFLSQSGAAFPSQFCFEIKKLDLEAQACEKTELSAVKCVNFFIPEKIHPTSMYPVCAAPWGQQRKN